MYHVCARARLHLHNGHSSLIIVVADRCCRRRCRCRPINQLFSLSRCHQTNRAHLYAYTHTHTEPTFEWRNARRKWRANALALATLCIMLNFIAISADNDAAATAAATQTRLHNSSTQQQQQLEADDSADDDGGASIMLGVIAANTLICVIGICGNSIVILVISRFTKIDTVTDIYILNLAFADLMFLTGLIFLITTMIVGHWIFGNVMCKLYMASTSLNQFASSLLLVVMSFDRFIAVCHPIYAQRFRRIKQAKLICLCIWIACLILMSPIFAFAKINKESTCAIFWPDNTFFNCELAFTMYSFAIGFALPLLLIACFYLCVIRKLRRAAHDAVQLGRSTRSSRTRETTNKRVEHLVIGIICTYTVCWLPYWVEQLLVSFSTGESSIFAGFYMFVMVATSLSYTNSALNPILYAFLSDNFKRRCTAIFTSLCSGSSSSSKYLPHTLGHASTADLATRRQSMMACGNGAAASVAPRSCCLVDFEPRKCGEKDASAAASLADKRLRRHTLGGGGYLNAPDTPPPPPSPLATAAAAAAGTPTRATVVQLARKPPTSTECTKVRLTDDTDNTAHHDAAQTSSSSSSCSGASVDSSHRLFECCEQGVRAVINVQTSARPQVTWASSAADARRPD